MEEEEMLQQEGQLEGVFSINDRVLAIVEAWDQADPTEVVKIWIATHASAPFVADQFARRLENYFWRLWSCESLMMSLSGSQIHAHVKAISEGDNIRTTPRGSPRSSRDLQIYFTTPEPSNPTITDRTSSYMPPLMGRTVLSPSTLGEDDDGTSTPTAMSPDTAAERLQQARRERRQIQPVRPPPILKKAGSSGSSRSTSSRSPVMGTPQAIAESRELDLSKVPDLSSTIGDQSPMTSTGSPPTPRYISTRFSEEVAVSIPQSLSGTPGERGERSPRSFGDSSRGFSKRSHVVHSGSLASRKRPIVMRQRSAQASSVEKPSPTSPLAESQKKAGDGQGDDSTIAMKTERRRRAVSPPPEKLQHASLTASSVEDEYDEESDVDGSDVDEPEHEEESTTKEKAEESTTETTSSKQVSSPLVDPNFRSRFALQARSQQHRSFTNLPSAAWRSTTTMPTATSYNASGMMFPEQESTSGRRGSARTAFKDEIIPLKAPAPAGPESTDDAEEATALPRTKSQLTLLLERNKAAGHDPKGKGPAK